MYIGMKNKNNRQKQASHKSPCRCPGASISAFRARFKASGSCCAKAWDGYKLWLIIHMIVIIIIIVNSWY
jgi:hypothetical protein